MAHLEVLQFDGGLGRNTPLTPTSDDQPVFFQKELAVCFPDNTEKCFGLKDQVTGLELLESTWNWLIEHHKYSIDRLEQDYFGLSIYDRDNLPFWIHPDKEVVKQLGSEKNVYLKVKFYPLDPDHLKTDLARCLLCLQVWRDIVSCSLSCSDDELSLLGSYVAQAELGDYDPTKHGSAENVHYLKRLILSPRSLSPELLEKICELHKQHQGLTPKEADGKFLAIAKELPGYGVRSYQCHLQDVQVKLSISARGITVVGEKDRTDQFAWSNIKKISCESTDFTFICKASKKTIKFRLKDEHWAKHVSSTASEHKKFFMAKK